MKKSQRRKETQRAVVEVGVYSGQPSMQEALLGAMREAVIEHGTDGKIEWCNFAAEHTLGYTASELRGRPLAAVLPSRSGVVNANTKGGRRALLDVRIAEYSDRGDRRMLAVCEDVTEATEMREQLTQARKEESIGRLASGIAHDFNNLLTAITGHAELAATLLPKDSKEFAHVQKVIEAAERAASLVSQLQMFVRRRVAEPKLVEMNDVIRRMWGLMERLMREDIQFAFHAWPEPLFVVLDVVQFEQVIMNLVLNARDAVVENGVIEVKTEKRGKRAVLTVTDNGIGMDEATQSRIFEPFFSTKQVGQGTGLGLAVCHEIVSRLRGTIHVDSKLGAGTKITVSIPTEDANLLQNPVEEPIAIERRNAAVLVVDDDPFMIDVMSAGLSANGYRAVAAKSPESAMEQIASHSEQIGAVLIDVVMPRMSGPELAKKILQIRPDMRVILMSGYNTSVVALDGVLESSVEFLQKPFSISELVRRLETPRT